MDDVTRTSICPFVQEEDIRLYVGISDVKWNGTSVNPGLYSCVSPVYGNKSLKKNNVTLPNHTQVIQDCGAFSDKIRLSHKAALDRQNKHANEFNYDGQIIYKASYDLLIDEKWLEGIRVKRRWSENEAWSAVDETVQGAKFIAKNYDKPKVISAQGVSAQQYKECVVRILPYIDPEQDMLGLGGWCISGKMKNRMMPVFRDTLREILPELLKYNIQKVHIWGVVDVRFLVPLHYMLNKHDIKLSTDSAVPQLRPVRGDWGYRSWRKKEYQQPPTNVRGYHRAIHAQLTRCFLACLSKTKVYQQQMEKYNWSMWL